MSRIYSWISGQSPQWDLRYSRSLLISVWEGTEVLCCREKEVKRDWWIQVTKGRILTGITDEGSRVVTGVSRRQKVWLCLQKHIFVFSSAQLRILAKNSRLLQLKYSIYGMCRNIDEKRAQAFKNRERRIGVPTGGEILYTILALISIAYF